MKANAIYYVHVVEGKVTLVARELYKVQYHHPLSSQQIGYKSFSDADFESQKSVLSAVFTEIEKGE